MTHSVHIAAFYKFVPVAQADLARVQQELKAFGEKRGMRGLVLVATEGINGTVCGTPQAIIEWKEKITAQFGDMNFNDSGADELVFPRWLVKVREEIVALKQEDVHPDGLRKHLTPQEWNAMMNEEDVVILDTRNTYETAIGTFENAIDPQMTNFKEFADYAKSGAIPKDKKVMMYCTGGIRCEKALIEMEKHGYDVFQLKGGILGYLKEFPEGKFNGECFVFDHRVSVDGNLEPSKKYKQCPHCGDPGDREIECLQCAAPAKVCARCVTLDAGRTCSKNCRHHLQKSAVKSV
jgi:UPF0176 protein